MPEISQVPLGSLAVLRDLISVEQRNEILERQLTEPHRTRFGELATELTFMDADQVDQLLKYQKAFKPSIRLAGNTVARKLAEQRPAKQMVALRAATRGIIPQNARLYVGAGPHTLYFFIALMLEDRRLTWIRTNNLLIASEYALRVTAHRNLQLLGGRVDRDYLLVLAPESAIESSVDECDYAVISSDVFDYIEGPTTTIPQTRNARQAILERAHKILFLCDHTNLWSPPDPSEYIFAYDSKTWSKVRAMIFDKLTIVTTAPPEDSNSDNLNRYASNTDRFKKPLGERFIEVEPPP